MWNKVLAVIFLSKLVSCDGQIISTDITCKHPSDCSYPKQCCYFKEYKSKFSLDDNTYLAGEITGKCCYRGHYFGGYGYYRMSFWNMWYFWFIVIFILLSCFGGCGYWRRRQWLLSYQNHQAVPMAQAPGHPLSLAPPPPRHHRPSPLSSQAHDIVTGRRLSSRLGRGLPSLSPGPTGSLPHPQGFVAPPGFDLYTAHASSQIPAMFSPARATHPYVANPPPHLPQAASIDGAALDSNFSSRGLPAPPPYVEVVGSAPVDKDAPEYGGSVRDEKMKDLPPSYAEAVAQMMSVAPANEANDPQQRPTGPVAPTLCHARDGFSVRGETTTAGVYNPIASPPDGTRDISSGGASGGI